MGNSFGKSGHELADAFEQIAHTDGISKEEAARIAGVDINPDTIASLPEIDPEQFLAAAEAIRAGAIPTFWPWIWFIPWIAYTPPGDGST